MAKKERVSIEDLDTAAAWLLCNEGENGEGDACRRVAAWLEAEANKREKAMKYRMLYKNGVAYPQQKEVKEFLDKFFEKRK